MDVDVASLGTDDALMGPKGGGDHGGIGLSTPHQEVDMGIGSLAQVPEQGPGAVAVGVRAIAGMLLQIGVHQGLEHLGVSPGGVVTFKAYHGITS